MTQAPPTLWQPNLPKPGAKYSSQELFLECPYPEALLEGGRGGGKTSALLMDFALDCDQGLGEEWRGLLFARTFKDLENVLSKSRRVFPRCFTGIRFYESKSDYFWEWPTGERLYLRHIRKEGDYWSNYHGHEWPWQGWEELTAWPDLSLYQIMIGCLRSSNPEVARRARRRATTNPWGPGHGAIKNYYVDLAPTGHPIADEEGNKRVRYYAPLEENQPLLSADPKYLKRTVAGIDDPNLKKAWKGGADRWEISAGAYFAHAWRKGIHVLPVWKPPAHWKVTRSFDWGSAKPFSNGWYAESPGETVSIRNRSIVMPRGTLVRFNEWYGASAPNVGIRLQATKVAQGILSREKKMERIALGGVADSAMWNEENPLISVYKDFEKEKCKFDKCKKGPDSRKHGWEECCKRLLASIPEIDEETGQVLPLEKPGFYVTENCVDFIRTVPLLQRDPNDPEDIDTNAEDHAADEWRYRLTWVQGGRTERDTGFL